MESVKAIIAHYGIPDVTIGHSLGTMANIIADSAVAGPSKTDDKHSSPNRPGENFQDRLEMLDIPQAIQRTFFENFEERFRKSIIQYNLLYWSAFTTFSSKHWVAYDSNDLVSPLQFISAFLDSNSLIEYTNYPDAGHERIIKSPSMIQDMLKLLAY